MKNPMARIFSARATASAEIVSFRLVAWPGGHQLHALPNAAASLPIFPARFCKKLSGNFGEQEHPVTNGDSGRKYS